MGSCSPCSTLCVREVCGDRDNALILRCWLNCLVLRRFQQLRRLKADFRQHARRNVVYTTIRSFCYITSAMHVPVPAAGNACLCQCETLLALYHLHHLEARI